MMLDTGDRVLLSVDDERDCRECSAALNIDGGFLLRLLASTQLP